MERFKLGGSCETWKHSGVEFDESTIARLYYQATNRLLGKFKEAISQETSDMLLMFSWLSLTETRRKCKTVTDLESFKTKEVEETVKFFCKSQTFVPKFSVTDPLKTHGAPTVTADPMSNDNFRG